MTVRREVRHLTPEELSERLGGGLIGVNTLKKWRAIGEGPDYIHAGKYVLYPEPAIEAWEREHLASAATP